VAEARIIQEELAAKVRIEDDFPLPVHAAGLDCGYSKKRGTMRAAVVVVDLETLQPVDQAVAETDVPFPYVPGYLSFRELPACLDALGMLATPPDVLVCDGQGVAHPRRFGLACHLGVATGLPAVGAAKSRLIGDYEEPGLERGSRSELRDPKTGERIGYVLRTRTGVKPLFVSPGHRMGFDAAVALVLRLAPKWRLPETTRLAHNLAGQTPS
jgi:deoxyribonuclease V